MVDKYFAGHVERSHDGKLQTATNCKFEIKVIIFKTDQLVVKSQIGDWLMVVTFAVNCLFDHDLVDSFLYA